MRRCSSPNAFLRMYAVMKQYVREPGLLLEFGLLILFLFQLLGRSPLHPNIEKNVVAQYSEKKKRENKFASN